MSLSPHTQLYKDVVARNLRRQYDLMEECITLCSLDKKSLNINMICYLHAAASNFLVERPGQYRQEEVYISYSDHKPPMPHEIPALMVGFQSELHKKWGEVQDNYNIFEVAAYALWRLNWIHPFEDANGRVSRAICHIIISSHHKNGLPTTILLPELIAQNDKKYRDLLRQVDKSYELGALDLEPLDDFVFSLLFNQLEFETP